MKKRKKTVKPRKVPDMRQGKELNEAYKRGEKEETVWALQQWVKEIEALTINPP